MGIEKYTSGRVDSQHKYDFQYGEIEWRARIPAGKNYTETILQMCVQSEFTWLQNIQK